MRDNEQRHNFSYTEENIDHIYQNVHRDTRAGIGRSILEVKSMLGSLSEEQFKKLARYLSYPRGVAIHDRESYNTLLRGRRVNQLMREIGKNNLDLIGMDLGNVKNWYAANLKGNAGRYMKTSSLIVTYNDLLTTGGHNLSSRISRVNSMTNYKRNRGNYTPTDYERPSESKPNVHTPPPSVSPSPSLGEDPNSKSSGRARSSKAPSVQKKPAKSSGNTNIQSRNQNVRPRNAVVPSTPRRTRGL